MKIRLISDLHIDINRNFPLKFDDEQKKMFTLVAGDVSGVPDMSIAWMKENIKRGAFISGNHDVYEAYDTIEDVKQKFHDAFPATADVTYFDDEVGVISKDIGENVLLVADVMYTDYLLPIKFVNPNGTRKLNIELADPRRGCRGGMNDFNYGECKKHYDGINGKTRQDKDIYRLVPEYYLEHHENAMKHITEVIESNAGKNVILMTHHCMSPRCLDDNYSHDNINASYASDKEEWIKQHPNIKCVVSGHIHCRKSFKINDTLYVMNALGYCADHLRQWHDGEYVSWTPECIIDTDSWTVEWKPHVNEAWEKEHDAALKKFKELMPFFL